MGIPGLRPRSGIGSLLNHGYNRDNIIQEAMARLNKSAEVILFANTKGWGEIKAEYNKLIKQLQDYELGLCRKARDPRIAAEIERTSAFVAAMQLVLSLTDNLIKQHEFDNNTITRNQETAQRIAG